LLVARFAVLCGDEDFYDLCSLNSGPGVADLSRIGHGVAP